jgi:hypothetical protein
MNETAFIVIGIITVVVLVVIESGWEKCPKCGKRFSKRPVGQRRVPPRRGRPFQRRRAVKYYRCANCDAPRGYKEKDANDFDY